MDHHEKEQYYNHTRNSNPGPFTCETATFTYDLPKIHEDAPLNNTDDLLHVTDDHQYVYE